MSTHQTVLLDLDGTLIDTAPDLVAALFATCDQFGVERPEQDRARREVANGGLGMIKLAFHAHDETAQKHAHAWFLDYYAANIAEGSHVFPAIATTLDQLAEPWGIVTNKPEYLTHLLLDALGLSQRVGCVVAADTLPVRKPDPAPLVFAAEQLGKTPGDCLYAGDHKRDIDAAHAAGMYAIAVGYGYNLEGDDPYSWGADSVCETPEALSSIMRERARLAL